MVERLLFIRAGAGAGEKITWSRSKTDRLRNTGHKGTLPNPVVPVSFQDFLFLFSQVLNLLYK